MKKLTLVSLMCRGKILQAFCYLPVINGKTILSNKAINILFNDFFGFIPEKGETVSIGI